MDFLHLLVVSIVVGGIISILSLLYFSYLSRAIISEFTWGSNNGPQNLMQMKQNIGYCDRTYTGL